MTPYYEREEWPAFLSAIRAAPDDDLPRLVAADWLDELETEEATERAELIRIQVEQWNSGGDTTALTRRAVALTRRNKAKWLHPLRPMEPRESGLVGQYTVGDGNYTMRVICSANDQTATDREAIRCEFTRGFLRLVSAPLAVLNGERCRCMEYTRLTGPCDCCGGTGRTPGVLGELLRREPVTAAGIEVTQVSPVGVVPNEYMRSGTGPERNWAWGFSESTPHGEYMIPREVWDLMPPTKLAEPRGRFKVFPTADAARLALSEALYRLHGPKSEVGA